MPAKRTIADRIRHLRPCLDALAWAEGHTDPRKAWAECQRGDWMLWLLGRVSDEHLSAARKKLVLVCCECARLALPYTKDNRVLKCIETAERWARGEATYDELLVARRSAAAYAAAAAAAAYAAAAAAAAAYAADAAAAYAAAYAADAADAAAAAAAAAADAAAAAAYAADAYAAYAAAAAARTKVLAQCADIVCKHYPKPPTVKAPAKARK